MGGAIKFRREQTTLALGPSIADLTFGCGGPIGMRMEGFKYTSPAVAGFIFDASIGEALKVEQSTLDNPTSQVTNIGRVMGVNLKYAGEFSGVRVAAGVGAEWAQYDEDNGKAFLTPDGLVPIGGSTACANNGLGCPPTNLSADNFYWAAALSLMHVPSGLFAQGSYTKLSSGAQGATVNGAGVITSVFTDPDRDATRVEIQAGISKNWLGIGNTVVWGEWGQHKNFKWANSGYSCATVLAAGTGSGCATITKTANIKGDELTFWGIGFVQNIDAAAMELYIDWRRYDAKDPTNPTFTLDKLDIVGAGARIKF
jgi:hypothetical protein